jgi:ankyrin repeat protein
MRRYRALIPWALALGQVIHAQVPARIDFARDVQPIFKTYCIGCHGPSQQLNGLRLDRRRDAMRGGTVPVIGPENAAASRLYLRLIGGQYGLQMPPTGALSTQQIQIIKAWIDQGAQWPDEVSGEIPPAPPDPKAAPILDALRKGDRQTFQKLLKSDPQAANRKGIGGSTPLMYAALYGDAAAVRLLLASGANPNLRNDAGATALMWAADDAEKTRLLLENGADANARSDDGRTPLMIAADQYGASPVVKSLLDHGAKPSVKASETGVGGVSPLAEAARAADEASMRLLIDHGAGIKDAGPQGLYFALHSNCAACRDLMIQSADRTFLSAAMLLNSPPRGDALDVKMLLDRGADANATDRDGHTILMLAASSDALPVEGIRTLLERGADIHAKTAHGETALDFAKLRGRTPVVDLLIKAGAKETGEPPQPIAKPSPAASPRAAVARSLPLLQRTDVTFLRKAGCVSCHNNSLTAMAVARARTNGLRVDEQIARKQLASIGSYIESWRERVLQGEGIPGLSDTISYILLGMAAENYPPDLATDALARYLKGRQSPDGRWRIRDHRPPLETSDISLTAVSLRAIQAYGLKAQRPEYEKAIQLGERWLENAQPESTEDRAFQLLGLFWAGGNKDTIRKAARALLAEQRSDGGWAQIPTLASDAYATGQALVALKDSGALGVADPAYKRGTQFLISTQFEDGSWYVRSRDLAIMPFFESDFPFGRDQWISAAATNWAAMALASTH